MPWQEASIKTPKAFFMRALIQRVSQASVTIDQNTVGAIDQGLLVLLGIQKGDSQETADKMLHKLFNYRVFSDTEGKMNLSTIDIQGDLLLVSQFTLAADTHKGLRPGFSTAAPPAQAQALYHYFVDQAQQKASDSQTAIATGQFGADMKVSLTNDGPVTFLLEI